MMVARFAMKAALSRRLYCSKSPAQSRRHGPVRSKERLTERTGAAGAIGITAANRIASANGWFRERRSCGERHRSGSHDKRQEEHPHRALHTVTSCFGSTNSTLAVSIEL